MTRSVPGAVNDTQRRAARLAGIAYLAALALAMFAEFYVPGRLVVADDPGTTARTIAAHELLFRARIVSSLATVAIDVVLLTALYVVLEAVNRPFATFAALMRLLESGVLAVAAVQDFEVLRLVNGIGRPGTLGAEQTATLASIAMRQQGDTYMAALFFFGCGSTMLGVLWLQSGYVPRLLAIWGLLASILVGVAAAARLAFPPAAAVFSLPVFAGPIFLFELTMGTWLATASLRAPSLLCATDEWSGNTRSALLCHPRRRSAY